MQAPEKTKKVYIYCWWRSDIPVTLTASPPSVLCLPASWHSGNSAGGREIRNRTDTTVGFKTRKKKRRGWRKAAQAAQVSSERARADGQPRWRPTEKRPAERGELGGPLQAGRKATALLSSADGQGEPSVRQRAQGWTAGRMRRRNITFQSLRATSLYRPIHMTMGMKPTVPSFGSG